MERYTISRLLFAVTLLTPLARAEHGPKVAEILGVKSAAAAAALDSGFRRPWDQDRVPRDPTAARMNAETSRFLRNAPGAYAPPENDPRVKAPELAVSARERMEQERERQEKERREALQQLEFRRNVEDAMRKILSFQPSPRAIVPGAFGARASEPEGVESYGGDPDGLAPRERLIYQAVGNGYRPPYVERELARVESPVETRVEAREPPPRPRQPATFNPELPRGLDEPAVAEPVAQPYVSGAPAAVAPSPEEDLIPALPGGYEVVPDERPIRVIADGEADANVTRLRR